MNTFTKREESLLNAMKERLLNTDAISATKIVDEIQNSSEYKSPSHEDHTAFLHMLPLAVGKEMELAGEDPYQPERARGLNDSKYADADEYENNQSRQFLVDDIRALENGDIIPPKGLSKEHAIQGSQELLIEFDKNKVERDKANEIETSRIAAQEKNWKKEEYGKSNEMRENFMKDAMRSISKKDPAYKQHEELAETRWNRLANDYGW